MSTRVMGAAVYTARHGAHPCYDGRHHEYRSSAAIGALERRQRRGRLAGEAQSPGAAPERTGVSRWRGRNRRARTPGAPADRDPLSPSIAAGSIGIVALRRPIWFSRRRSSNCGPWAKPGIACGRRCPAASAGAGPIICEHPDGVQGGILELRAGASTDSVRSALLDWLAERAAATLEPRLNRTGRRARG